MNAGRFIRELTLNFGVMVTLIYVASVVARRFASDDRRRPVVMVAMAVLAGWITFLLAVRVEDLVFDLRFLPGVLVALYATRRWVITFTFVAVGLARFWYGFNRPASNGFVIMVLIGVVLGVVSPWVARRGWSTNVRIVFHVTTAVTINLLSMLVLQRSFFPTYFGQILPVQYAATTVLCFASALIFSEMESDQSRRASLMDEVFKDPLTELHNRRHFAEYVSLLEHRRGSRSRSATSTSTSSSASTTATATPSATSSSRTWGRRSPPTSARPTTAPASAARSSSSSSWTAGATRRCASPSGCEARSRPPTWAGSRPTCGSPCRWGWPRPRSTTTP